MSNHKISQRPSQIPTQSRQPVRPVVIKQVLARGYWLDQSRNVRIGLLRDLPRDKRVSAPELGGHRLLQREDIKQFAVWDHVPLR